jgi:dihydrofolate reductase
MKPKIVLIGAVSQDGVYGIDGRIPWQLPGDLAHFKKKTLAQSVCMGRNTWLSLPEKVRPLLWRKNIVVSSRKDFDGAHLVTIVPSIAAACEVCDTEILFIIGGAEMWKEALPLADEAWITIVEKDLAEAYDGKVVFCPELLRPHALNRRLHVTSVSPMQGQDFFWGMLTFGIYHWESGAICEHE